LLQQPVVNQSINQSVSQSVSQVSALSSATHLCVVGLVRSVENVECHVQNRCTNIKHRWMCGCGILEEAEQRQHHDERRTKHHLLVREEQ
jgi:hypothetical protein